MKGRHVVRLKNGYEDQVLTDVIKMMSGLLKKA